MKTLEELRKGLTPICIPQVKIDHIIDVWRKSANQEDRASESLLHMLNDVSKDKQYESLAEVREEFGNIHKQIPKKGEKYIVCNKCNTIQTPIYFDRGINREKIQDCWNCGELMQFTPESLDVMS